MDSAQTPSFAFPLGKTLHGITRFTAWFFELPVSIKRPVLFLVGFLIIVFPAFLYDLASVRAYTAAQWVSHTSQVGSLLNQTLFDLRDAEASARTQLISAEPAALKNFETAAARLPSDLNLLQQLTIDNPAQQVRIGQLRACVDGRIAALHEVLRLNAAGHRAQAAARIGASIAAFPFREITDNMIAEENRLLVERERTVRKKKEIANWVIIGSVLAQLLLCATIYRISEKDVRRRQEAEELSTQAAAQAQTIVETNPDPLIVLNPDLRIESCNEAFLKFYSADRATVRGQFLREVGRGAWELPELQQRLADLIPQQREIWDMEVNQTIGDDRRVMLINARPLPGKGGGKLIFVATKDMTARKRSEEQITRLNHELSVRVEQTHAVNQELEAFSYSVSHDLRAPLRHITGFADMLTTHLATNADAKTERYLKFIRESAGQMGSLIDDLLVFSRMGRTDMNTAEVDMNELVREVIKHFSLEIEGRKIHFEVGSLPSIKGDSAMLRLVWMNLVGNAIKYTRTRPETRIEIGTKSSELPERIYFIQDNGVGFNMKYIHKLFGVFQRLHQADEYEGTGIGLANVRRIVQRHGGKVWAQGYLDQGATFYFSLPLEPNLNKDKSSI